MAGPQRIYVEKVTRIAGDNKTGLAKITFSSDAEAKGDEADAVELVMSVMYLREAFEQIGEKMSSIFGEGGGGGGGGGRGPGAGRQGGGPGGGRGGPGGPGGQRGGGPRGGGAQYKDLTE